MMSAILYWAAWIFLKFAYYVLNFILIICYWGKNKTVPPITNSLLLSSGKELAKQIREGKLKSEDVIQAYIERINEVNPYINAVVQNRFKDALEEAKEADALVQSGKFTTQQLEDEKPLLGVPFTVKVLVNVKDLPSTAGCKVFKDRIATEDSPSVTLVKKAGGIVLANTNAAEFGTSFETNNLIHGKTSNPYDTSRTAGGSSGGESALLGAGGSVIGLGNDFSGSVRIPAHFTGVFSHKATVGLVPSTGCFPAPCPDHIPLMHTGPMCRYSEDLVILMDILTSGSIERPKFGYEENFSKLKIFYSTNCGDPMAIPVDKDILKAMHKAISHFSESYGTTAKEIKVPLLDKANTIILSGVLGTLPNPEKFLTLGKVEHINVILEIFKFIAGNPTFSLATVALRGIMKFLYFKEKNLPYSRKILKKLDENFDNLLDENSVFIYPTFPVTAPHHYGTLLSGLSACYSSIFNFLGLPATNCPIGFNRNRLPQGMQIIARRNNDPLTLACAVELEKVFGGWLPSGSKKIYAE